MIGLVTLYKDNYGSILQAFSTCSYIESLGEQCEILQEKHSQKIYAKIWRRLLLVINIIRFPQFRRFFRLQKKVTNIDKLNPTKTTLKKMNDFIKKNIVVNNVLSSQIEKKDYKYFITGSDQVWKSVLSVDLFRFLTFAPREKRIALAASFGISEIPKYNKKKIYKALSGFDYISVREETGLELVKKYSEARVCRLADPTFIYNADEWRTFAKNSIFPSQRYILVHFLNEPNEVAMKSMNWLSDLLNLDIVAIGYKYNVFSHLKRFAFVDGGPLDYVSMIDHAEFVLTDSFHSSLYSINFNKRFFVFHRNYSVSKQTSRISDLLKRFKMENRLISDVAVLKQIYLDNQPAEIKGVLEKERTMIRDYIEKSISGQVPQCFSQGARNG